MKVTREVEPILDIDKKTLTFLTREKSDMTKNVERIHKMEINFKEETIKKALIKLGWTPPVVKAVEKES